MIRPLIILFYLFVTVIMGAVGDGMNNSGIQTWGHLFEAIEVAMLFSAMFLLNMDKDTPVKEFVLTLATYVCLRFAFFDYAYNIAAQNPLTYLSENNFWGRFWLNVLKAEPQGIAWARLVFLIVGISLPLKFLRS